MQHIEIYYLKIIKHKKIEAGYASFFLFEQISILSQKEVYD